jgi:4-hydroxy-3-polyprenylbenzoate decarboxylase
MGIDATRKWPTEGFARPWPDEVDSDRATKQMVDRKWTALIKELGI